MTVQLKYARTTMNSPCGNSITARLNLVTGEIKPYAYRKKDLYSPPRSLNIPEVIDYSGTGDLLSYTPHWVDYMQPRSEPLIKCNIQGRKNKVNNSSMYLTEYDLLENCVDDMPRIDDCITGVVSLEYGNNRPISGVLMFKMLRDLDNISTESVRDYTGYGERHCQRLALHLRVLSNALDSLIES